MAKSASGEDKRCNIDSNAAFLSIYGLGEITAFQFGMEPYSAKNFDQGKFVK